VEDEAAMTVEECDRFRMMYDLAEANPDYAVWDGPAVYQRNPNKLYKKTWMSVVLLSKTDDDRTLSAMFIGTNGSGVKSLVNKMCCTVVVMPSRYVPYIRIAGTTASQVRSCRELVKRRLEECIERMSRGR